MKLRNRLALLSGSERGAAAVELAVVLPFLIVLLAGVVDYGRAYYVANTVANAARAAAEYGARNPAYSADTAAMRVYGEADAAESGKIYFTVTRDCKCPPSSAYSANVSCGMCGIKGPYVFIKVRASKTLSTLLRYPSLPSTITIARESTFQAQ